jgi:hypothetical protein
MLTFPRELELEEQQVEASSHSRQIALSAEADSRLLGTGGGSAAGTGGGAGGGAAGGGEIHS